MKIVLFKALLYHHILLAPISDSVTNSTYFDSLKLPNDCIKISKKKNIQFFFSFLSIFFFVTKLLKKVGTSDI